jgi:DNA-binding transcriptional LysR family regulator
MILKELTKSRLITINYYKDGLLLTCKGRVNNLDLFQQTLSLRDENQQVYSIRLSSIKEIQVAGTINELEREVVRVGTFPSVATQWLPHIIKKFEDDHLGIVVQLFEGDYSTLIQWVSNGVIDCSFLTLPTPKSLDFLPLKKDKMLCILSDQHPFHAQERISYKQIQAEHLIMPKEGWGNEISQIFKENDIKPKVKFEVSDDQTIMAMVQNNLGISIRPEMTLNDIPNNVFTLNLENESFRFIGIATKPNKSPSTKKFVDCVHSWLSEHDLLDL